jgi:hypothetical protein
MFSSPLKQQLLELQQFDAKLDSDHKLALTSSSLNGDQDDDNDDDDQEEDEEEDDEYQAGYNDDSEMPFGMLYCALCRSYVSVDSFSALQSKVRSDEDRYCLNHTGASTRFSVISLRI